MVTKITNGIEISVQCTYQADYSDPISFDFMFAYKVTILNKNNFAIKLLSRHWFIVDAYGSEKQVQGDGVVGVQPVIAPNNFYEYISGTNMKTEIGKMYGVYAFQNLNDHTFLKASIPVFYMEAPLKFN